MQTVLVGNVEVDIHEEDGVVSAVFEGKDILEAIIELGFYDQFEEKVFKECNASSFVAAAIADSTASLF